MKYSILTILIIADLTMHHYLHSYLGLEKNVIITANDTPELTLARKPLKKLSSQEELIHALFDALKKPLPHASAAKSEKIAEILLQQALKIGADINTRDTQGNTMLDLADARGFTHLVTLLREHGAKTYTRDGREAEYVPGGSLLDFLVDSEVI